MHSEDQNTYCSIRRRRLHRHREQNQQEFTTLLPVLQVYTRTKVTMEHGPNLRIRTSRSESKEEPDFKAQLAKERAANEKLASENNALRDQLESALLKIQKLCLQRKADRAKWSNAYDELQQHVDFVDNCTREYTTNAGQLSQHVAELEDRLQQKEQELRQARVEVLQWQEQVVRLLA